jgi:hypothetical protein
MERSEMIGWIVGLLLGLALITAGVIAVVETVVLRPASDRPGHEQRPD